ncbi:MAG TPA: 16S rRNA (guanine(966)-N(2))-methyltransferase RsmD [Gammaproteobacteria bacterium]|nr:16S rRNA (guanine(966)-N(2))-methyltransferase RsmD [Gammaproteobacteria bacterium]
MHNRGRGYRNEFRIIAGDWRRRRLGFPLLPGIRPSPDRVRETLFNWLQGRVTGMRCLDLFAGSGALGLEALSRGAASCVFVDRERAVIETLRAHLAALHARGGDALQSEAMAFLGGPARAFDLVFLDPPFASELLPRALHELCTGAWLRPGACIYVEYAAGHAPSLPDGWQWWREARAGQVGYGLVSSALGQAHPQPA